jgi:hypothetical protein
VFVFATDTEPGSPFHDRSLRELAQGADVLVYDAQYTPEELRGDRKGWGHSSWLEGTRIARECGVKQLVLFHHDPDNDDAFVDGLVERARQEFPQVRGAAEGLEFVLPQGDVRQAEFAEGRDRRRDRRYRLQLPMRLALRGPGGERVKAEGFARDVSRSGIYFVTPSEVWPDEPMGLEVVLPDEITHRGEVALPFVAEPLRLERLDGALDYSGPVQGVAAHLVAPEEAWAEEKSPEGGSNPS